MGRRSGRRLWGKAVAIPRPSRVLLVFEPPDGGVPEHVFALAAGLGGHGYAVEVAGPGDSAIVSRLAAIGVAHHSLPLVRTYARPGDDLRAAVALVALIRRRRFDIVHSHSSKAGVLGRVTAWAAGAKTVYSPHGFGFVGEHSRLRKLFALTMERALSHVSDAIVCVSEDERSRALRLGVAGPDRLVAILQGTPASQPGLATDPGVRELAGSGPVVGTVTTLRREKRVDLLLRAIPLVWRARPEVQFAIVGNGYCQSELEALADHLGLATDARFRFLPFTGPSQRYLQGFAVFVLTSGWEALPISALEALACGVPSVVTDVGGLREAIDDTVGRLLPTGDPAVVAEAVLELLGDEGRRLEMSCAAVRRHAARFTVQRMVAETAELYRALDGRRPPS